MTTDTSLEAIAELRERVMQFRAMRLPGEPMGVHMGTSYLVGDLDRMAAAIARNVFDCSPNRSAAASIAAFHSA